jgi:hypothetical protein
MFSRVDKEMRTMELDPVEESVPKLLSMNLPESASMSAREADRNAVVVV